MLHISNVHSQYFEKGSFEMKNTFKYDNTTKASCNVLVCVGDGNDMRAKVDTPCMKKLNLSRKRKKRARP